MARHLPPRAAGARSLAGLALAAALVAACGGGASPGEAAPVILAAPASLTFTAAAGGAAPFPAAVAVSNAGGGALAAPAIAIEHAGPGGWLSAAVTGAAPPFSLAVSVDPAGLAPGTYLATIRLSAAGASNSPLALPVRLDVIEDPCAYATPGPAWIAYSGDRGGSRLHVRLVRADGTCDRAVSDGPGQELYPAFDPSVPGGLAYVAIDAGRQHLVRRDVAGGPEARLDLGDVNASAPAFSPDGAWIAFEATAVGGLQSDVRVVPAGGGATVTAAGTSASESGPAWGPGGSLYFVKPDAAGVHDVWVTDAAGAAPTQVTTGAGVVGRPAVSPDGALLAYARRGPGQQPETVVRTLATGEERVVGSPGDADPAFSPDGARLAVSSTRTGLADVWLVPLDGGAQVRVTSDAGTEGLPAVAP